MGTLRERAEARHLALDRQGQRKMISICFMVFTTKIGTSPLELKAFDGKVENHANGISDECSG